MKPPHSPPSPNLEQVYLIERDAGLLCRILGLYASPGIDVLRAEYAHAAQDVMSLKGKRALNYVLASAPVAGYAGCQAAPKSIRHGSSAA